jgi:DNA-directed RNA polymerase specialized sigma24 family protein
VDPAPPESGAERDAAWENYLLTQSLEQARAKVEERQFQIFDLSMMTGWPPGEVALTWGFSLARVYLTKHRVAELLKKELRRLEKPAAPALRGVG